MADLKKRLETNIGGDFFVDSTCIDCDTCRQLAPAVFEETGEYSSVYHQPQNPEELRGALRALLACPTGSIGTQDHKKEIAGAREDFPMPLEDGVYYNGYNSPKSYGGNSYFVKHPDGNWLIDSPKFLPDLVEKFRSMGGMRYVFLTHQDDVADAEKYAKEFGATRIIHRREINAQPDAERIIEDDEPVAFGDDFLVIPTPGHTAGHCVLLYRNKFLFTGDHLWWRDDRGGMGASHSYCWFSWEEQKKSLARLLDYEFEWLLPGHGRRKHLPKNEMHAALGELVSRLK